MTDQTVQDTAPETPAAEAPTVAEVPAAEPAAAPEAVDAPATSAPHTDTATLLEDAGTAEAAPEAKTEDKGAAEPQAEPAKPEPVTYADFTMPEGITPNGEMVKAFTDIVGPLNVPQDQAQALVDLWNTSAQKYADSLRQAQHDTFAETRRTWRNEIMADPEMGGAGFATTTAAVARMRDLFVPEGERQSFNDFLRVTGAGDHPVFWRLMHRVSQRFDEPAPAPLPQGPAPGAGRPSGRAGGAAVMYDHPSSQRVRG